MRKQLIITISTCSSISTNFRRYKTICCSFYQFISCT